MRQNVWIFNHYATTMFNDKGGRHYWFAENLIKKGYAPTIFCASTIHNSNKQMDTGRHKYLIDRSDIFPFVFVEATVYTKNDVKRVQNMISFYRNLFPVAKKYAAEHGEPDVIIASSPHPLTLIAANKIAKKFGVPSICEVRDLWPESIFAYNYLNPNNVLAKALIQGEKWIYKNADQLIFTMEGGKDYILEKGWDMANGGPIDIHKVNHINNGVDLETFEDNVRSHALQDSDLDDPDTFKIVYTGSIREVNDVGYLLDVAKRISLDGENDIKILIYGDGDKKADLVDRCAQENITNVVFKGRVPKNQVPYILSKSDLNILHFQQNSIKKYGASLNKLFEYFASGKPIISDSEFGYDLVKRYDCGVVVDSATPEQLAEAIINIKNLDKAAYDSMCDNAYQAAKNYDFEVLTDKLIDIIERA